jgi:hypothetical protein
MKSDGCMMLLVDTKVEVQVKDGGVGIRKLPCLIDELDSQQSHLTTVIVPKYHRQNITRLRIMVTEKKTLQVLDVN